MDRQARGRCGSGANSHRTAVSDALVSSEAILCLDVPALSRSSSRCAQQRAKTNDRPSVFRAEVRLHGLRGWDGGRSSHRHGRETPEGARFIATSASGNQRKSQRTGGGSPSTFVARIGGLWPTSNPLIHRRWQARAPAENLIRLECALFQFDSRCIVQLTRRVASIVTAPFRVAFPAMSYPGEMLQSQIAPPVKCLLWARSSIGRATDS